MVKYYKRHNKEKGYTVFHAEGNANQIQDALKKIPFVVYKKYISRISFFDASYLDSFSYPDDVRGYLEGTAFDTICDLCEHRARKILKKCSVCRFSRIEGTPNIPVLNDEKIEEILREHHFTFEKK